MNTDYPAGAFFKSRIEPKAITRHKRKAVAEADLLAAYALVDARDHSICWVTGRTTKAKAASPEQRREHHHLRGRNVKPEWVTDPNRIITVAAEVHDCITNGWLVVEGDDARKPITFAWAEGTKPAQKIFVIQNRQGKR